MKYIDASRKLSALRKELSSLRAEMRKVRNDAEPETVKDYQFVRSTGEPVKLSQLFGDKEYLFIVHNMGANCVYCTLWADGFNGVNTHLQNRAAFIVSTPDEPAKQAKFASQRGWSFPMVSHHGTTFAKDMGYSNDGKFFPGVSVFTRKGDQIVRLSDDGFGPGDDYAGIWHLFDLIPAESDWRPKYAY